MSEQPVYINGLWKPSALAAPGWTDAGFVSGVTVVDLARTFGGRLFRWPDHLARFRRSCALVGISSPEINLADAAWTSIANESIRRNSEGTGRPLHDWIVVIFATPGPIASLSGQAEDGPATIGLYSYPIPLQRYRQLIEKGAVLALSPFPVTTPGIDPRVKHRSRLGWWLADRDAARRIPGAVSLSHDGRGRLLETAMANFLLVRDRKVLSPRNETILDGISRRVVRELCQEIGIDFIEADISLEDCRRADEAILCSTVFCIACVRQIENVTFATPGPIFRQIAEAWNRLVGFDFQSQFVPNST